MIFSLFISSKYIFHDQLLSAGLPAAGGQFNDFWEKMLGFDLNSCCLINQYYPILNQFLKSSKIILNSIKYYCYLRLKIILSFTPKDVARIDKAHFMSE